MIKAKVIQERVFLPYKIFLDSSSHFCEEMKRKDYVSWYDLLAAITILGLSVEALVNTIGVLVIPDFKDFESSSPKAKLRILCEKSGIEFNRNKSPFLEVINLLKVRNQLAHPKFQVLHYESKEMPLELAQKHYEEIGEILHDIEKSLTPEFAKKSLEAVLSLEKTLRAAIQPDLFETSSKRLVIDGEDICKSYIPNSTPYKFKK